MKTCLDVARKTVLRDQAGVTAVEYALVAGALVAGVGLAFTALTGSLQSFFTSLTF